MLRKSKLGLGLALFLGGAMTAKGQQVPPTSIPPSNSGPVPVVQGAVAMLPAAQGDPKTLPAPGGKEATPPVTGPLPETQQTQIATEEGRAAPDEGGWGPTPLTKVNIINSLLWGDDLKDAPFLIYGWLDADYTYRSTGHGVNNVAPVMNRFGDEALLRQFGLYITKPLDPKCLSWGFNSIFIVGSDASFLTPTAGGWANTNPRFGASFTDLNLTMHLPILTEGGVDVKAGRQTTVLGPMGALPWQRFFTSSDYAWYNMEEGRYTGVSATWHVTKRFDWYNGIEFGWGSFFDYYSPAPQYITQLSYWLDEDAKNTKVWTTVLTGPTGQQGTGNSTTFELGIQHNWNKYVYQIIDTQMVYSKCPIFGPKPPGYIERAYDVYTYLGAHLNPCWDINSRFEWYRDVDGGGYPGGFGVPNTNYFEITLGPDYHPTKWLQFRPEVRYDWATNPNFGRNNDRSNQLSIAAEILIKF